MIDDDIAQSQLNVARDVWFSVRLLARVVLAFALIAFSCWIVTRHDQARAATDVSFRDLPTEAPK